MQQLLYITFFTFDYNTHKHNLMCGNTNLKPDEQNYTEHSVSQTFSITVTLVLKQRKVDEKEHGIREQTLNQHN